MSGTGESPPPKRGRQSAEHFPLSTLLRDFFPGIDPTVDNVLPCRFWQHPSYVACCLGQDPSKPLDFAVMDRDVGHIPREGGVLDPA